LACADGRLYVEVQDNGIGGAAVEGGTGLSGLSDRIDALGGELRIDSPSGNGTLLVVELPCEL
jgi:signal transduction histidine kinase